LGLQNQEMARELRITPEWYSKVVNGKVVGSLDLLLRLDDLVRRRNIEHRLSQFKRAPILPRHDDPDALEEERIQQHSLKAGVFVERDDMPESAKTERVASRFSDRKSPATRKDCETYFQALMTAAEISDDPNAFPVILHRLRKEFPLDEWPPAATEPEPERK
jgi:transcriptional regulator with XRE-family HTH domain